MYRGSISSGAELSQALRHTPRCCALDPRLAGFRRLGDRLGFLLHELFLRGLAHLEISIQIKPLLRQALAQVIDHVLGFVLSTTLVVAALSHLYGARPGRGVTAALLLSIGLWLLFVRVLALPLPVGSLWIR